jgi:hypothetical protein
MDHSFTHIFSDALRMAAGPVAVHADSHFGAAKREPTLY